MAEAREGVEIGLLDEPFGEQGGTELGDEEFPLRDPASGVGVDRPGLSVGADVDETGLGERARQAPAELGVHLKPLREMLEQQPGVDEVERPIRQTRCDVGCSTRRARSASGSRKRISVSVSITRPPGITRSASASATVPVPAPSSRQCAPGPMFNCWHSQSVVSS